MAEKKYKIEYDREGCIGAGSCVAACPENWEMAADNKANFKQKEITEKELKANMDAAAVCPVNVIHIIDKKTGTKLI
jgi:ferredoxin